MVRGGPKGHVVLSMTTSTTTTDYQPTPMREGDGRFVGLAAELGEQFAPRAAEHDRKNTFVTENFRLLREAGYTRLPVPEELGGLGASLRQVCYAQEELGKYCASTALAVNMHLHPTLSTVLGRRSRQVAKREV